VSGDRSQVQLVSEAALAVAGAQHFTREGWRRAAPGTSVLVGGIGIADGDGGWTIWLR
jgi:hypothetical protein